MRLVCVSPALKALQLAQFAGLADVSISEDIPVEGEISVPVGSHSPDEDYSTLDEPVKDTIVSSYSLLLFAVKPVFS